MKYIKNTTEFYIEENTVLSLGKFDGIHRGHELLLSHMAAKKKEGLAAAIFTFDIPPSRNVLGAASKVLTTNAEKMHIFERLGVDYLIECPFTQEIRCMEAEAFIEKIVRQLHVKCMVVGEDFRFGHQRRGDYRMLLAQEKQLGYQAIVVEKMQEDARDISSTFIREEITAGNIAKANHLLGYRYFVTGEVVHGNQFGRTMGIPTMNQLPPEEKSCCRRTAFMSRRLSLAKNVTAGSQTLAASRPSGRKIRLALRRICLILRRMCTAGL